MRWHGVSMLPTMIALLMTCAAGSAQDFVSPGTSFVRSAPPATERSGSGSWLWVHAGIAVQVAGSFADWATSWKQPEGNQWLAESGGPYAGKFYRSGLTQKAGLTAGIAVVSYAVAWKWPKARKYVGIFNMAAGAGFAGAAISNVVRNPYYKP